MVLGRPRQFDRAEALAAALEVFWTKGYEATSITDLLQSMGINRGSLYDTFGDKESLFAEALSQYGQQAMTAFTTTLEADTSPISNLRDLLTSMVGWMQGKPSRGCLMTNTAVELAPHNVKVATVVSEVLHKMERLFTDVLRRAVAADEVDRNLKPDEAARFLVTLVQGVCVISKTASADESIEDSLAMAEKALGVKI